MGKRGIEPAAAVTVKAGDENRFIWFGHYHLFSLQAMEIFPTCVRQSGIGLATFISQMISIGGPYVIYLGLTNLRLPYSIMFLICVAGVVAAVLLPETAGRSLPETMADAAQFGKGDKFFSYYSPKASKSAAAEAAAAEDAEKQKLNTAEQPE